MKTSTKLPIALFGLATLTLGCPSDDGGGQADSGSSSSTGDTTAPSTMTTPMTSADSSGSSSATTSPDGTAEGTATAGSSSTGEDPTIFHFNDTPPEDYVRVDRIGFPAVSAALHIHGDKDAYNAGNPITDGDDLAETRESLVFLHHGPDGMNGGPSGLDDEIGDLLGGPSPACTTPNDFNPGQCVNQGGGVAVFPDTLKLTTDLPPGFHIDPSTCGPVANGRALANPVIDIILAVLLLDLNDDLPDGVGLLPCDPENPDSPIATASAFLGLPGALNGGKEPFSLNPIANDVEFPADFPYLAPAHTP